MAGKTAVTADGIASRSRAIAIARAKSPGLRLSVTGFRRETVTRYAGVASPEEAIARDSDAFGSPTLPESGSRTEIDGVSNRQTDSDDTETVEPRPRLDRPALELRTDRGRARNAAGAFRSS